MRDKRGEGDGGGKEGMIQRRHLATCLALVLSSRQSMNATAQWPSLKILLVGSISLLPTRSKEKDDDAMMRSLWWQEDSGKTNLDSFPCSDVDRKEH